ALHSAQERHRPNRRWRSFVPRVETLERRDVPSTLLASGLQGGTGSAVGPGGMLYVTEGAAGRIACVDPKTGAVTTFASGLPVGPFGGLGGGANDIAFIGQTAYVLISGVADDVGGHDVVGIYRVDGPSSFTVVADIGDYALQHPPHTSYFIP